MSWLPWILWGLSSVLAGAAALHYRRLYKSAASSLELLAGAREQWAVYSELQADRIAAAEAALAKLHAKESSDDKTKATGASSSAARAADLLSGLRKLPTPDGGSDPGPSV